MAKKQKTESAKKGGARAAKKNQQPAPQPGESTVPDATIQFTPAPTLKSLLKKARDCMKEAQSIAGEFGQAVANAVDQKFLHRKAFNIIKGLDRMTDEKLAECLTHFDYYREQSGLQARADKVMRLPMGDGIDDEPEGEAADDTEHEMGGEGVVRGNFGSRLRETQGENYGRNVPAEGRRVAEAAGE